MNEETKNPEVELETEEAQSEKETACQSEVPEDGQPATQDAPEQPSLEQQLAEQNDKYMRLAAEYENFRKRTARERESLTAFVVSETVQKFLPVLDSLQLADAHRDGNPEDILAGLDKVLEALNATLTSLGLTEIDTSGELDPNLHNAVMHVEDESLPKNSIVEVFQKGYLYQDKVVRHAMVKVAN